MSRTALLVLALAACGSREPSAVQRPVEMSTTRADIDHFVDARKTPDAFVRLASSLDRVRLAQRDRAADAELRLLALANPLVESARRSPLEAQAAELALTVWPVLLDEPLTAAKNPDVAPRDHETASAYVSRMCETVFADQCTAAEPAARTVTVRAIAMRRADARMRAVLGQCLECGSNSDWVDVGWKWESLASAASR